MVIDKMRGMPNRWCVAFIVVSQVSVADDSGDERYTVYFDGTDRLFWKETFFSMGDAGIYVSSEATEGSSSAAGDGVKVTPPGIEVIATYQESSDLPAEDFTFGIDHENMLASVNSMNHEGEGGKPPGLLNLVIIGTLTVTVQRMRYVCEDMRIAEGPSQSWWIASAQCEASTNFPVGTLVCSCGITLQTTPEFDHFQVFQNPTTTTLKPTRTTTTPTIPKPDDVEMQAAEEAAEAEVAAGEAAEAAAEASTMETEAGPVPTEKAAMEADDDDLGDPGPLLTDMQAEARMDPTAMLMATQIHSMFSYMFVLGLGVGSISICVAIQRRSMTQRRTGHDYVLMA
jgi:hypothetical protein